MRLILYNMQYASGLNGSLYNYFKIWKHIKAPQNIIKNIAYELKTFAPDFLALVEIDSGSPRAKKQSQIKFLQDKLNLNYNANHLKYSEQDLRKLHKIPYFKHQENAFLSNTQIIETKFYFFSCGTKRLVIESKISVENKELTFIIVHLSLTHKNRQKQFIELSKIIENIKTPLIVAGDFNNFKGELEFTAFAKKTNLNIAHSSANEFKTYPSHNPKKHLDHVFYSNDISIKKYKVIPNLKYSDHLPILVDFVLK
ncbi:MAG: endonuclease/exonuclease/phosphatase family protein [Nanoarchaeota archaeon]|nr:endonuclease/exonuclease/phosphatase family protein [Nanoarchaeota archaeon]